MKVLLTGGAGYIGSHTAVELLERNYEVIIIDNFSNSKKDVIDKIKQITKKDVKLYEGDVRNKDLLHKIFKENKIDAVIHFAGLKAVGESCQKPLMYYDNNLISSINLLEVMKEENCKTLVFSSSATVYGKPEKLPIKEDAKLSTSNPYGSTKLMIEMILQDLYKADETWNIAILRYFNPIGAHESGLIGENPKDIPNNLMPYIVRVATKEYDKLKVFGNDYDTKDGTGVRDYIHVVDLAIGHVKAIEYLQKEGNLNIFNLGTGEGYSVLELVKTFEEVNNVEVPYEITERRPGDIDACYADPKKANEKLNWKAEKNIKNMCEDSYRFILKNRD